MEQAWNTKQENDALRHEFEIRGLDSREVFAGDSFDMERENRVLRTLLGWVDAYRDCPDRKKLAEKGFEFPPVEPDYDPDTDWLRFERWVNAKSASWDVSREILTAEELKEFTEEEVSAAFKCLCDFLEFRGVVVDYEGEIPDRLAYREVASSLAETSIPFMGAGSTMHLDACSGYCPGCVRRPWCEIGNELRWDEDEDAGHIVFPPAVKDYVSPAPGSLALLRDRDDVQDDNPGT